MKKVLFLAILVAGISTGCAATEKTQDILNKAVLVQECIELLNHCIDVTKDAENTQAKAQAFQICILAAQNGDCIRVLKEEIEDIRDNPPPGEEKEQ